MTDKIINSGIFGIEHINTPCVLHDTHNGAYKVNKLLGDTFAISGSDFCLYGFLKQNFINNYIIDCLYERLQSAKTTGGVLKKQMSSFVDGVYKYYDFSANYSTNDDGHIVGLFLINDITSHVETLIAHNLHSPFTEDKKDKGFITSHAFFDIQENRLRFFDHNVEKMLGYDNGQLGEFNFFLKNVLLKKYIPVFHKLIKQFERKSLPSEIKFEVKDRNGSVKKVFQQNQLIKGVDGEVIGVAKTMSVLQGTLSRHQQIAHLQNRIEICEKHANFGFFEFNPVTKRLEASDEFYKILEIDRMPILESPFFTGNFFPTKYKSMVQLAYRHLLEYNRPIDIEVQIIPGSVRTKWIRLFCIMDETFGNQNHICGLIQDIDLKKRKERSLSEVKSKLSNIYQASTEGIIITDMSGFEIVETNNTMADILGRPLKSIVGQKLEELLPIKEHVEKETDDKNPINKKIIIPLFDLRKNEHETIPVEVNIRFHYQSDKLMMVCQVRDLSPYQKALNEIKRHEKAYREALSATNDGVFDYDFNENVLRGNKKLADILKIDQRKLKVGPEHLSIIHEEDRAIFEKGALKVLRGEISYLNTEFRLARPKGEEVWLKVNGQVLEFKEDGTPEKRKPLRMIGAVQDISQNKFYAAKILKFSRKINKLISLVSNGITLSDEDMKFDVFNPAMMYITGYSFEEVNNTTDFFKLLKTPEHDYLKIQNALKEAKQKRKIPEQGRIKSGLKEVGAKRDIIELEITITTKQKHRKTLILSIKHVSFHGEKGYLCVYQDITERKKNENEMQANLDKEIKLQKEQKAFISIVHHEFNNPLSVLKANVENLQRYFFKFDEKRRGETFKRLNFTISEMENLVAAVNSVYVDVNVLFNNEPQQINFEENINDIIYANYSVSNKHVEIEKQINTDIGIIEFDPRILRFIVSNMLSNAIKFSDKKIPVRIITEEEEDTVSIIVQDFGIGIPPDEMLHIKEPFKRGSNVYNFRGTGLGMAIIDKSVRASNGTWDVQSELNKGTTIKVNLPFKRLLTEINPLKSRKKRLN